MAQLYDRVKQTSTSTGTGDFTLSGSVGGFKAFSDVFSVGDETYYCITADDGEFEVGQGTYSAANTLQRDVILASTNNNTRVTFNAGAKSVFITYPATESVTVNEAISIALSFS